jgi:hypothetical protein
MSDENSSIKKDHEIAIALIQKDIEYIKNSMEGVTTTLAVMDKNFVRHDELASLTKLVESLTKSLESKASHDDVKTLIDAMKLKVDKSDFDPIRTTLGRINWILISTVIVGLLALLYKAGGN